MLGFFFRKGEFFSPLSDTSFSKVFYDNQGKLIRISISSDEKYRVYTKLSQMPAKFIEAIQLSEDRWFYYHLGVNPLSLFRAVSSMASERRLGASTITMQLVRLNEKIYTKNIWGKLQQMFMAVGYEYLYSKNQILEAYINLLPFGANIEGLEAASLVYFNKSSAKLDLAESLILAVIPQNPIKRNLNQEERDQVHKAKERLAHIWFAKYPQDKKWNLEIQLPLLAKNLKQLPNKALHFTTMLSQKEPFKNEFNTSIDIHLQESFELIFKNYLKSKSSLGIQNGAVLLIDNKTAQVKAWIGSGDFFSDSIQGQIDGVTTPRSPGSALKPFLYGLAMDEGIIHPESMLKDTQSFFGGYDPENFDRKYKGPMSAAEALIQSRNVPAIYLASQLKRKTLYQWLQEAGQYLPQNEKYYGLAITLGTAEVSPEKLAELYSLLARQGVYKKVNYLSEPKVLAKDSDEGKKLLSAESSFLVLKMLSENPRSESYILDKNLKQKNYIAWKTGTSWGYRDAWTAGVVGPYTLVVWLGNFNYASNPQLIGREMAAPLFFQLVDTLPAQDFLQKPSWAYSFGLNLKQVKVCSLSGQFTNGDCPHQKETFFIPGVSPIAKCTLHREILIANKSGLRLCDPTGYDFHKEVYEFWPSDLQEFFSKMNLQRRTPPPFVSQCKNFDSKQDEMGTAPLVVLPKMEMEYLISYSRSGNKDSFPLKAIVDAGVKKVTWFANNQLLGQVSPEETLMAKLGPGKYTLMVVDDQGRFAERKMSVKMVQ